MPTTRKKVIKTVYKNEDSEEDGDFSDSGSDAKISAEEESSSEEDLVDCVPSSGDEFDSKSKVKPKNIKSSTRKPKFNIKTLISKVTKQPAGNENDDVDVTPALFSVKDLSEADKLLPPILNLSESESSDDESPKEVSKKSNFSALPTILDKNDSDNDVNMEYKDVFSNNLQDNSEEIAKKTFLELQEHKSKVDETKASIQNYTLKMNSEKELDVNDLLAMGEEVLPEVTEKTKVKKKTKSRRKNDDSDSEMEELEEVQETKEIPKQGIQLFVEFPDAACRKKKKVDVEMMMKRKINRVKKEYQVYMHKVHVLCWLGHGNFVSRVLNDQELMAAVLSLVPSKECYPGERVDMKYVEQITTWYKDKLTLKQDKNEDKFKPKAPPLKTILLGQIKNRVVTTKKYLVFIFVAMLRALGLQCRVMFNFVTLPLKPPTTELCSLSTKPKDEKAGASNKSKLPTENKDVKKEEKNKQEAGPSRTKTKKPKLAQVDGNDDRCFSSDNIKIMQVDGGDDTIVSGTRKTRSTKRVKSNNSEKIEDEDVSPPKVPKKSASCTSTKPKTKLDENKAKNITKQIQKVQNKVDVIAELAKTAKPELKAENINSLPLKKDKSPSKSTANTRVQRNSKNSTKANSENVKAVGKISVTDENVGGVSSKYFEDIAELAINTKQELQGGSSNSIPLKKVKSPAKTTANTRVQRNSKHLTKANTENVKAVPKISVTDKNAKDVSSMYFEDNKSAEKHSKLSRKRSQTVNPNASQSKVEDKEKVKTKARTKSAPGTAVEKSKYFESDELKLTTPKRSTRQIKEEDSQRVSHRDLAKKKKGKGDVTGDLVDIIKTRIKDAKIESRKGIVKGKKKEESDEDSDYLPVEDPKQQKSESDDDFKPAKISPKPSTSKHIDRRVLSSSSEEHKNKVELKKQIDVWCEIFVEELEQWISVDVIKGRVHSIGDLYGNATHPVCYVIGWDNNNYLKDLTRKYVPHWNTVTRKLRVEPPWWDKAIKPWLGPNTARDKEENEYLDRMQLDAPLPKSISEYKNHPLYALKRHLLKFEAIYPPDAAVLGFVRLEAVYARECVYTCRSRDTWLKEAKVVKLGEKPYKVVKARPKWDKLSNKLITDKPLEVFGPWQVQDYEPPTAENGVVPRNAYGNVELFKDCMLPKGTVHIKLPGLNRVAKKLNIDCAPAMTGFDFNGGWSHPVYDGFVVCKEFEEVITEAWLTDQEEQERKELEKTEARVYGNWRRLIRGLFIRERLKCKYGFEEPSTSETSKKSKGPRLVVKKKS